MNEPEGIHPPDWDRYQVTKDGAVAPVGDPTRWGAQVFTPLTVAEQISTTPQILQISTRDGYARAWSILGTLTLPFATWNATQMNIAGGIQVELLLTLGVGQVQIEHSIMLLNSGGTYGSLAVPFGPGGLCLSQFFTLGGPYNEIDSTNAATGNVDETRAFAIVGGLVGQSIAIRARYRYFFVPAGYPTVARLALITTPYAAGEGL